MAGKKLSDRAIFEMTDEQRLVLNELAEIAAKELKLSKDITELTEAVRKTHQTLGFERKEAPESLFEDPEIEALITARVRFKIESVREQIRRSLSKAIELGLGELELVQRQARNYGLDASKR